MEKMNNISMIENFKKNLISKKIRKNLLKLEYYKRLIQQIDIDQELKKNQKLERLNRYQDEDTEIIKGRLNGKHHNLDKIERLMKTYDEKSYWKKRRFKVLNQDKDNLEVLLSEFEKNQLNQKTEYLSQLNNKYNNSSYSEDQILQMKQKLSHIESNYAEKKRKFVEKNDMKVKRNQITKDNIQQKINKMNDLNQMYYKKMESIHEKHFVWLKYRESHLTKLLNQVESHQFKNKSSLQQELDAISSKLEIIKNPETHLVVKDLKMYFGGVKAVNDLSFEVKKGEIFGLIGPNGAGKTTVFNCITQFYRSTGGYMYFRNKENQITNLADKKVHEMIQEGIARSFQNVELIWELTVLDNLLVAGHSLLLSDYLEHMLHSKRMLQEESVLRTKGYELLKKLGIEDYAFRSPYGLPYGVLKKIELARTLMTDPTLIILDEPAAGLNDQETKDLAKTIKEINQSLGITIFLVEHDMGLVMSICDRICAISFGKKLALGIPSYIQNHPDVKKAYLGEDIDE